MLDLGLIPTTHITLYDTAYPGVCDPMPQWQVTWNPPDCNTQPHPDVRGLMPPAAWAHAPHSAPLVETAAAPVALAAVSSAQEEGEGAASLARPAPAQLLLCGQALVVGAASTAAGVLSGEASIGEVGSEFRDRSIAAAGAVSPLGAFVLERDVFGRC
mmetsp:Transcript_9435/g.23251  ORF Transcript_9435/g.23251 Transcript_9435/m.23251 type:complete len:158 (+) Transcript_9435:26-499(+)